MKTLLAIPDEALDAVMAVAFQLYQAGRYSETEVLCRGLIATDHKEAWSYSLYAATLRRMGRPHDALAQIETGLAYEPDEPKLLYMGHELREEIASDLREAPPKLPAPRPRAVAPGTFLPPPIRRPRPSRQRGDVA